MQRTLSPHRECSNRTTRLTFSVVPASQLAVRNLLRATLTYVLYHKLVIFYCHFIHFVQGFHTYARTYHMYDECECKPSAMLH